MANALIHYRKNKVQKERKKKMNKSVDGPARKKKKRIDDTAERDEQNKCEEEESTSKTRKRKVPRE